ncbi:hypothetical protein CMI47_18440 [Candidatus Pacearchaeota archaeon]|nr:hypothetical protein [Candidatus Pacearchaeota archaeon]
MSIKKLFESTEKSRNYLSSTDQKDAFKDVESAKNVAQIAKKQSTFVPQVNYGDPKNFVKYGSANLYYKSAMDRIVDFYPYDGSDAEVNEFFNDSLDIDNYIFDNLYPRTNGYVNISADGWGTKTAEAAGYGIPSALEYITLKGGPNTTTSTTTAGLFRDPESSKRDFANIYDTDIYTNAGLPSDYGSGSRESNLQSDFDRGVTVEFWLKTGSAIPLSDLISKTEKQVIFDLWNNNNERNHDYGRIIIELSGASDLVGSPFRLTVQSGTAGGTPDGFYRQALGQNINVDTLATWNHYAIKIYNTGSTCVTRFFVNGIYNDQYTHSSNIGALPQKDLMGRIGALLTASAATTAGLDLDGAGKLSGSIDEFRFWKNARTGEEIIKNWFVPVRGGTNSDISNTTLGVYYKFNEGITTDTTIDSTVLDYSGRISNGEWTGYSANSRSTGSAIVEATASATEFKDPIIYKTHPTVVSLKNKLQRTGSYYDFNNNASIRSLIPSWIIEEVDPRDGEFISPGESTVEILAHILGTYFDTLRLSIQSVPSLRYLNYVSASYTPVAFGEHLPQSLGLYTPEIFIDATVLEKFLNRDEKSLFEGDLTETKNLIYQNLYNNLTDIFKSKGTEKSVRNVLRCFNVDDKLIRLNVYSNNQTYELKNNLRQTLVNKKMLNFNTSSNMGALVYLADTSNGDGRGYISGSEGVGVPAGVPYESKYGFTAEADIHFPNFEDVTKPADRQNLDISLFGMHSASIDDPTLTTWYANDNVSFQVLAVRDEPGSKNIRFKLTSSLTPNSTVDNVPFPTLTSDVFYDVYDNQLWNLSVRLRPSNPSGSTSFPLVNSVSGAGTYNYDLIFKGINAELGVICNSFEKTATISQTTGQNFLKAAKRIYVGARRTNITGTLINPSDVLVDGVRYWLTSLDDLSLNQHAYDIDNYGISGSYRNVSPLDWNLKNSGSILNSNMLALSWDFNKVHSSNTLGSFTVTDVSSGSATLRNYYGWIGEVGGYQHIGSGSGWPASTANIIYSQSTNAYQFINPEIAVSSDMVQILSDDDTYFGVPETPPDYYYTLEKSMYNAISEEMLNFFAGVVDFNNVIGEPVNRYRTRYKTLEKLREIFFRRVDKVKEVEKFLEYYKWFDDALAEIIGQMVAATGNFTSDTYNTIESHVLERNKYWTKFPTLEFRETFPEAVISIAQPNVAPVGQDEGATNFDDGAASAIAPSVTPGAEVIPTNENEQWWITADPTEVPEISSGDDDIDQQRANNNSVMYSLGTTTTDATFSPQGVIPMVADTKGNIYAYTPPPTSQRAAFQAELERQQGGGTNYHRSPGTQNKSMEFIYNALYPGGPINTDNDIFVPVNTLFALTADMVPLNEITLNPATALPNRKIRRVMKVQHGRNWEEGTGYSTMKSTFAFPFNIMSSSVTTGYNKRVVERVAPGLEVVNLHNDVYGPDAETPMQGPFTDHVVGGHQSRHIAINAGPTLDTYLTRPEAWKLLLGKCPSSTGAIGMVGVDYPWPEANSENQVPYPMTASQKAVYYRGFVAKRPVNIKNIQHRTGSTILGNYESNYQIINTVGATSNPQQFIKTQPTLPTQITQTPAPTQGRSYLDIRRDAESHFQFTPDYSLAYLGAETGKSVIISRFSAPGDIQSMGLGYKNIRAGEFSPYNALPFRNWSVIRPFQDSGSISEATGSGTPGIRVVDQTDRDYGLRILLARHSARFGRDSRFETQPPGKTYNQLPSFQKVNRNRFVIIDSSSAGYSSGSQFDNAFVTHQIPRSDRQYSWMTASLISSSDVRYYRYEYNAPGWQYPHRLFSGSTGYVEYFDFVTGSAVDAANGAIQPIGRLNTLIVDPVNVAGSNTLGFSSTDSALNYYNSDIINSFVAADSSSITAPFANYFNLLMAHRRNTYGWNWTVGHQGYSPIFVSESANNTLELAKFGGRNTLTSYPILPVSMKGRPAQVEIITPRSAEGGMPSTSHTKFAVQTSDNNERIFFNNLALDNYFNIPLSEVTTPYDKVLSLGSRPGYNVNAILYTQGVYPAYDNEFYATTTTRTGYDNKFWRNARSARTTVGATLRNSFSCSVSQSCEVLDAQTNFLTRTKDTLPSPSWSSGSARDIGLKVSGAAGELQNNYFSYWDTPATGGPVENKYEALDPAALLERKHMLTTPKSAQGPWKSTAINVAVDAQWGAGEFNSCSMTLAPEPYAGEALWEANTQAGRIVVRNSIARFEATASNPWFNKYDDFRYDLRLLAKDYSIVPEFRISEHVEGMIEDGILSELDTFEIVGTDKDSSQDTFYKTYSNSEITDVNYTKITNQGLDAKQIKLVVSAAIRFNPYRGFYPAHRAKDLIAQFSKSYSDGLVGKAHGASPVRGGDLIQISGSLLRPLMQAVGSPGITFNAIRSGMAVDYPIIIDPSRFSRSAFTGSSEVTDNWAIVEDNANNVNDDPEGYHGGSIFDVRLPFETVLDPESHLTDVAFIDCEPHPSVSLDITSSFIGESDGIYSMMARNYYGEVANFFLKNKEFSYLKSGILYDDLRFEKGDVFGARLVMRRPLSGDRTYGFESGSDGTDTGYAKLGATAYSGSGATARALKGYYPIPQDPIKNPKCKPKFVMCSRPTAFGPPISGRPKWDPTAAAPIPTLTQQGDDRGVRDFANGHNWAYTNPCYYGEAWCDFIFRPIAGEKYDAERILSEMSATYRRFDPGNDIYASNVTKYSLAPKCATGSEDPGPPYGGSNCNENAMQISASVNLFGIEREFDLEERPVGSRWVIQSKFETPMLNYSDNGIRPIANNNDTLTLPTYGSASVTRGIWHQFGTISKEGVSLEIGDIPQNWLKYHYDVITNDTVYNDNHAALNGRKMFKKMKSLTKLMGFERSETKVNLGEITSKQVIKEAIVVVPYITEGIRDTDPTTLSGVEASERKKFINIPIERVEAVLNEDTKTGKSLEAAGASIRKLIHKMQRYVLPPQFDFLNNADISPLVMYLFEFEYELDRDDLAYIWQNIAPREYQKISLGTYSVAHDLSESELLDSSILQDENLRWMVFKVKQRSESDYYDKIFPQADSAIVDSSSGANKKNELSDGREYEPKFNWPYDYVSIVEMAKMDIQVLYKTNRGKTSYVRATTTGNEHAHHYNVDNKGNGRTSYDDEHFHQITEGIVLDADGHTHTLIDFDE